MIDGIYRIMVHGWLCYYKFENNKIYYPDYSKGKYVWQRTIVDRDRYELANYQFLAPMDNAQLYFEKQKQQSLERRGIK